MFVIEEHMYAIIVQFML